MNIFVVKPAKISAKLGIFNDRKNQPCLLVLTHIIPTYYKANIRLQKNSYLRMLRSKI